MQLYTIPDEKALKFPGDLILLHVVPKLNIILNNTKLATLLINDVCNLGLDSSNLKILWVKLLKIEKSKYDNDSGVSGCGLCSRQRLSNA